MIIQVATATALVKVLVTNSMTTAKFGEQTQLKGMKIKGMMRIYSGDDDVDNIISTRMYMTLKKGVEIHFDKFPVDYIKIGNSSDTFSLVSERPIDWANSYVEWQTPLAGLPPEGKYITFLVLYESAKIAK